MVPPQTENVFPDNFFQRLQGWHNFTSENLIFMNINFFPMKDAIDLTFSINSNIRNDVISDGLGPQKKLIFLSNVRGNPQMDLQDQGCEYFNARDSWLSISNEEELHLSRSLASTIRNLILSVLQKMITYGLCQRTMVYAKMHRKEILLMSMFQAKNQNGYVNVAWLIARLLKRKGVGSQRDSMICYGQFITRMSKRIGFFTNEVLNRLSALTYYRALDATTLRELVDSNGRLIAEEPAPGVPQVAIPRPSRPSMHDLYDLIGAYAPPGYDKEQQED
ncbi:hypothetical protein Tco_0089852 [Tanacetum coccineum]